MAKEVHAEKDPGQKQEARGDNADRIVVSLFGLALLLVGVGILGWQSTMKPVGEDSWRVVLRVQAQSESKNSAHALAAELARWVDSGCPSNMLRVQKAAKAVARGRG